MNSELLFSLNSCLKVKLSWKSVITSRNGARGVKIALSKKKECHLTRHITEQRHVQKVKCFQNSLILQQLYKPGELFLKRKHSSSHSSFRLFSLSLWSKKLCLEAMTNPGACISLILHAVLPLRYVAFSHQTLFCCHRWTSRILFLFYLTYNYYSL